MNIAIIAHDNKKAELTFFVKTFFHFFTRIAALLVEGKIDIVFFFIDPLDSHPHEVDVHMLLRLCNVHNITLATNKATATHIIHSILASSKIPQS